MCFAIVTRDKAFTLSQVIIKLKKSLIQTKIFRVKSYKHQTEI